jgi:hypothetical protein
MSTLLVSPMSRTIRREALIEWMSQPEYTHAITLAPNRENISLDMLRRLLGGFCCEIDKLMLGSREVHRRYSWERLALIAMPEKLDTNPHLHCVANFSRIHWQHRLDKPWETELPKIWRRVTRGSGELKIELNSGEQVARYITKEALRRDHDYFLSQDFHPDRRIADPQLKSALKLIGPERKAA